MLQIGILSKEGRGHSLPTTIELLRCDPRIMNLTNEERIVDVAYDPYTNIGCGVGIELRGLLTTSAPRRVQPEVTLEKYEFIPHHEECAIDENTKSEVEEYLAACQVVADDIRHKFGESVTNHPNAKIDVQKFLSDNSPKYTIIKILNEILNNVNSKIGYYSNIDQVLLLSLNQFLDLSLQFQIQFPNVLFQIH